MEEKSKNNAIKPVIFTIPWTTASEDKLAFLPKSVTGRGREGKRRRKGGKIREGALR